MWTNKKRALEEKRKAEQEEELVRVQEEFMKDFSSSRLPVDKAWVKGEVVNSDEVVRSEKSSSRLYKPNSSKLAELANSFKSKQESSPKEKPQKPTVRGSRVHASGKEKRKSNLELFKEELREKQEEREERHRVRKHLNALHERGEAPYVLTPSGKPSRFEPPSLDSLIDKDDGPRSGINFDGDPNTTNLYLANIAPQMSEQQLCELFGEYGPLASIKIMWPRTEEERDRGRHCGFVGFMNRQDADNAYHSLKGQKIMDFEMRLSWGKSIAIPLRPIYVPPRLIEASRPPPPSGLPFNAQPSSRDRDHAHGSGSYGNLPGAQDPDLSKTLEKATVKVVVPTERSMLFLIHRLIEFVVREGPVFEAMIMNREISNPVFRFLFDNKCPAHAYYRWKLYSILQGDEPQNWRIETFKMFKNGSYWRPPPRNPYANASKPPEKESERQDSKKGDLNDRHRKKLEELLRGLTPERVKVGELMVWCLEHAEAAEDVVDLISESLSLDDTPLPKKVARLYLVSDILHNSSAKVPKASYFRKYFEGKLLDIFWSLNATYERIEGRLKAEQFKQKIMSCFRAWEGWALYPTDTLVRCQNAFLGLVPQDASELGPESESLTNLDGEPLDLLHSPPDSHQRQDSHTDLQPALAEVDIDGIPVSDDLDGAPLDDLDGEPMMPTSAPEPAAAAVPKFTKTKWETLDDDVVKAQAMTTSKWDLLEDNDGDKDIDGAPLEEGDSESDRDELYSSSRSASLRDERTSDNGKYSSMSRGATSRADSLYTNTGRTDSLSKEKRQKLREIEVKVVKYQDELEAGKRSRKIHMSISEQVEYYRQKLLAKEKEEPSRPAKKKKADRSRSSSPRSRRRSRSPRASRRSRSKTPPRRSKRSKSRSRSPDRYSRHKKSRH